MSPFLRRDFRVSGFAASLAVADVAEGRVVRVRDFGLGVNWEFLKDVIEEEKLERVEEVAEKEWIRGCLE